MFIGGEIPHLVKKIVNRLEQSYIKKNKIALEFRGQTLSLNMIKEAWLWDDKGFGTIRKTKLTEDHFCKNAYSRICVHLGVQVVSESVAELIERYTYANNVQMDTDVSMVEKYAPLKEIWNVNHSKKCGCINSPNHLHIKELHTILLLMLNEKRMQRKR